MSEMMPKQELLDALEPTIEDLLERHLRTTKEWHPHEYIPYSRGRDINIGEEWQPDDADLAGGEIDDAVRSSLVVNLLTEDNLPYYFRTVETMFGADKAWGEWVRRWTAEEGRHSMVIFGYLATTRAVDLVKLEQDRMAQVSGGEVPQPPTLQHGFVYLALQELATRIAHLRTGQKIEDAGDRTGYEVMKRVAADENLHQLFYRDLAKAALQVDPNGMMLAMNETVQNFTMPGTGIPGFKDHAKRIAAAGIYDLDIHHHQILQPVVDRTWGAENIEGLTDSGAEAQESLYKYLEKSARVAGRLAARKEKVNAEESTEANA